jgi:hypothetical protein
MKLCLLFVVGLYGRVGQSEPTTITSAQQQQQQ